MLAGILIDLSGVLYVSEKPVEGAIDAINRIRSTGLPVRYVTNTTRSPATQIITKLNVMGFSIEVGELYTAPMAAYDYIVRHQLSPYLLIHPALKDELDFSLTEHPDAVFIGDAENDFTYENMNRAFRILKKGATLIGMGKNRYFQEQDGLSIDAGAFLTALEYAAETKAVILGKPSVEFFMSAMQSIDCKPENTVMIGDDVESDVNGAIRAGLSGILVQTGKYRPGDEKKIIQGNGVCLSDINAVADWVIELV